MPMTDRDIEQALRSAARIIDRYGDVYWPLFERLENELTDRRSKAARLRAHLVPKSGVHTTSGIFPQEKDGRSSKVRHV